MTLRLNFSPDIEHQLREKAAQHGQSLEAYFEHLAAQDRDARRPALRLGDPVTVAGEFRQMAGHFLTILPNAFFGGGMVARRNSFGDISLRLQT